MDYGYNICTLSCMYTYIPELVNKVVDENKNLSLGNFISRTSMKSIAKWHECIGYYSNLDAVLNIELEAHFPLIQFKPQVIAWIHYKPQIVMD